MKFQTSYTNINTVTNNGNTYYEVEYSVNVNVICPDHTYRNYPSLSAAGPYL